MELVGEWGPLVLAMLATGIVAGVMAGLLGVGGGIVIVPVLDVALGTQGVDPAIRMHIAVATSLATIILTSVSSTRAHHQRGSVDFGLARNWGGYILAGSVLGAWLASHLHSNVLALIFGAVAVLLGLRMLLLGGRNPEPVEETPRGAGIRLIPLGIGGLSSMMGIGGGTFSVPVLSLLGHRIHRAVGTSALFGLLISVPGAIAFVATGWGDPRLPPGSLGFVNLLGLACIAPATMLAAPYGARLAHRLNARQLNLAFGIFLLVVSGRMLLRAL
ncbi:MAG: sulfite exporter TauE/SafE family protein [Haliea sp.]|uniref:sulfite exporter TauE/SafE family protein n=1 Tax=Haliea sp. TaxID=1932666 RepID=UPI0032EE2AC1